MNYALDAIWWRLRHPAVRDLAALLTAPPLWHSGCELPIPRLLGSQGFRFLLSLDDAPAPLTQWLEQEAPFGHRLGRYAESLLAFWLARAPHCQLIARNHPVRSESGQTLGAADFLCLLDSAPYHLELTCKYYGGTTPDDFQGLNPADTLLGKAAKLQQQCHLFHTPQARAQLPAPLQGYLKTNEAGFCGAKTSEASFCEAKTNEVSFCEAKTSEAVFCEAKTSEAGFCEVKTKAVSSCEAKTDIEGLGEAKANAKYPGKTETVLPAAAARFALTRTLGLLHTMHLDRLRAERAQLWTEAEIAAQHRRTFTRSLDLLLAALGSSVHGRDLPELVDALGWCSTMRDLPEDLRAGIVNIPSELWRQAGWPSEKRHDPAALSADAAFRDWMRQERSRALQLLDQADRRTAALNDETARRISNLFARSVRRFAEQRLPARYPWLNGPTDQAV